MVQVAMSKRCQFLGPKGNLTGCVINVQLVKKPSVAAELICGY